MQKDAIERKCDILWEMMFRLDKREERRKWRENLRRTRSQSDMDHVILRPLTVKAFHRKGLLARNWPK